MRPNLKIEIRNSVPVFLRGSIRAGVRGSSRQPARRPSFQNLSVPNPEKIFWKNFRKTVLFSPCLSAPAQVPLPSVRTYESFERERRLRTQLASLARRAHRNRRSP